ncbi:MAG: DUF924 family protein [Proteobacteria bacterium]|nr:DUF924 family protein [Pseudomonadota bacterium]
MIVTPNTVLDFWFSPQHEPKWFDKDPTFDDKIKDRFLPTYKAAKTGSLSGWMKSPEGALALTIVLDQFPRNIFRDTADAFATDSAACHTAVMAIERGFDRKLAKKERVFLYMPFMHAESLNLQKKSVQLFAELGIANNLKFAEAHYGIIEKFGRFPHRNLILERPTTPEEADFLKQPGSSF